jgi:hypothetical protein
MAGLERFKPLSRLLSALKALHNALERGERAFLAFV